MLCSFVLKTLGGLVLAALLLPADIQAADARDRHVVLISVDGLPAYLLDDPSAPLPNIRRLAEQGVAAEGMTVSNPSVTWPNHTSLVTGVRPEKHGVLFNGVLEKAGPGLPIKVNPRKDKADLVHVSTLYDVLAERGLTTGEINWPCTRGSKTLVASFPDVPETFEHTTPAFVESLKRAGIVSDASIKEFGKLSPSARDLLWTRAACHLIADQQPNFVLVHLLNVDAVHHKYGPKTFAGYSAVAYADACVGEILEAIEAAGLRETTTVMIVADHGFQAIPKTIQPNVLLRQAGLLTVENNQVATARAHVFPEGGIGMLYLTTPDKGTDREKVLELFRDKEGVADVLTPVDFGKYGLPQPDQYEQMADLIIVAKDGYGVGGGATGDDFVVKSEATLGTHGFLSTNPLMNAVFIAAGAGVKPGTKLPVIENIDVAPTVAKLLGVDLPNVDGQVLLKADGSPAK